MRECYAELLDALHRDIAARTGQDDVYAGPSRMREFVVAHAHTLLTPPPTSNSGVSASLRLCARWYTATVPAAWGEGFVRYVQSRFPGLQVNRSTTETSTRVRYSPTWPRMSTAEVRSVGVFCMLAAPAVHASRAYTQLKHPEDFDDLLVQFACEDGYLANCAECVDEMLAAITSNIHRWPSLACTSKQPATADARAEFASAVRNDVYAAIDR